MVATYKEIMLLKKKNAFNSNNNVSLLFFFVHVIHVWDRKEVIDFSLFYIKAQANIKNCSININEVVGITKKNYEQFFKNGMRSSKG